MKGVKRFAKTVDVALGTVVTPCKRRTSPAGTARAGVCANHAGTANNSLPPAKSCPHRRCDGHSRRLTHASAKSQRNLLFCAVPRSDWAGSCLLLKALPHGPYPLAAKRGNAMVGTEAVASARSREEAGPTPRTPIVASVELDHCSRCIRVVEPMHALGAACLWAAPVCWTYDVTACSRVPESVRSISPQRRQTLRQSSADLQNLVGHPRESRRQNVNQRIGRPNQRSAGAPSPPTLSRRQQFG